MSTIAPNKAVEIFYSYAHEDEELLNSLEKHLRVLKTRGLINEWDARQSTAGSDLAEERLRFLNKAQIILLCVSADYLASDDCIVEMQRALQRHNTEGTRVIPVLLRPSLWQETPLAKFALLPSTATPVTRWPDQDDALLNVATGIQTVIRKWDTSTDTNQSQSAPSSTAEPTSDNRAATEPSEPAQRSRPLSSIISGPLSGKTATIDRPLQLQGYQNRQRMLDRVRAYWITGVLEKSLHGAALITVGLHERADVVENPVRLVLQEPDQLAVPLPPGTRITEVFDNAGGELLILGGPGSGKTTLLLELTRDLLDRARADETYPIPAVFNLSSWATRRQPLTLWLVEELSRNYQVPRKVGQAWVESDQILPLLDGLDEVALEFRSDCVDAINLYRQEHGLVPTVVCSRIADYLVLPTRVILQSAVVLQPLTPRQIDDYLASVGEQVAAVRVALPEDPALQEMATTPLMLNVLTLAYSGKPVEDLLTAGPLELQRQQVFTTYVQRMLQRRRTESHYTLEQTTHWLSWLAKQLVKHKQIQFYIERMQMDWLPDSWLRRFSPSLALGLVYGVSFGLIYGLYFGLIYGMSYGLAPFGGVRNGLLIGLFNALLFILLNGLLFGLIGKEEKTISPAEAVVQTSAKMRRNLINVLGNRWVYGLLTGLFNGVFITWLLSLDFGPSDLSDSLILGLISALFIGVAYGVLGKLEAEIQPAEVITWSWRPVRRNLIKSLLFGLLLGIVFGLSDGPVRDLLITQQVFSGPISFSLFLTYLSLDQTEVLGDIFIGLVIGLIVGLSTGLSNERLAEGNRVAANEGIRRSARNSLLLGLGTGLVFGAVFYVTFGRIYGPGTWQYGPEYGPAIGLAVGIVVGMRNGGVACIQHVLLRMQLRRADAIPWNYPHFLDFAAEHFLLRKVGGGYIFIHRRLLEYFATLDIPHSDAP